MNADFASARIATAGVTSGMLRRSHRPVLTLCVVIAMALIAGSCGSGGVLDQYTNDTAGATTVPAGGGSAEGETTGSGGNQAFSPSTDPAGSAQPVPSPIDVLESLINGEVQFGELSPEWRLSMVYELWSEVVESGIVFDLMTDALDAEAEHPTPGSTSTWFSESQELMQAYATSIPVDEYTYDQVRSRMASAPAAARPWYLVAIGNSLAEGYLEDLSVGPEIVATLADHPDPAVAMHLMNLVGRLGLVDATDTLAAYLSDPLAYNAPDETDQPPNHPLRDGAAGALRALGRTVYQPPDQPGTYVLFD